MNDLAHSTMPIPQPLHPGDLLAESILPALGASISQAARDLGVSRQTLHGVIAKDMPITPELAVRLEDFSGCPAEVWLLLQVGFDLWRVRAESGTRRGRVA